MCGSFLWLSCCMALVRRHYSPSALHISTRMCRKKCHRSIWVCINCVYFLQSGVCSIAIDFVSKCSLAPRHSGKCSFVISEISAFQMHHNIVMCEPLHHHLMNNRRLMVSVLNKNGPSPTFTHIEKNPFINIGQFGNDLFNFMRFHKFEEIKIEHYPFVRHLSGPLWLIS